MSPGLKSTKRYGPVPTGLRFVGASRDLAPLNASKRCLGTIIPVGPQKGADQKGVAVLKTTLTVWLSSLSMRAMSRYWPEVVAAAAPSLRRHEGGLGLRRRDADGGEHRGHQRRREAEAEHCLEEGAA